MLTPRQILERIAQSILSTLDAPAVPGPWRQSRVPYEQFAARESGEIEHHGFALQLTSTLPEQDRQVASRGTWSISELAIRWGHRIRTEAVVNDLAEAHDAELELVKTVKATDPDPNLAPRLLSVGRSTTRDGLMFIGEIRFAVPHYYPLA